jgi:hypothetical protein
VEKMEKWASGFVVFATVLLTLTSMSNDVLAAFIAAERHSGMHDIAQNEERDAAQCR